MVATSIDRWRFEVLAYHSTAGASNGPTEAVNLLVDKIRRIGHGYRNFTNYRRRLLLGCGVELVRADCLGPDDTVTRVLSPRGPSGRHSSSANRCQRWSKPLTECSP